MREEFGHEINFLLSVHAWKTIGASNYSSDGQLAVV